MEGIVKGIVKFFDDRKGWGFITADSKDYFAHHTEIKMQGFKTLLENQKVEFEPGESEKGLVAKNIRKI